MAVTFAKMIDDHIRLLQTPINKIQKCWKKKFNICSKAVNWMNYSWKLQQILS